MQLTVNILAITTPTTSPTQAPIVVQTNQQHRQQQKRNHNNTKQKGQQHGRWSSPPCDGALSRPTAECQTKRCKHS